MRAARTRTRRRVALALATLVVLGIGGAVGAALVLGGSAVAAAADDDTNGLERPADESPLLAELRVTLDALVTFARPDGGWTFATVPGERVHPHTYPLRLAERIAAPFGLADWDIVVIRSPGTPSAILTLLDGYRWTGDERYLATAARAGDLLVALQLWTGGWFSEMPAHGGRPVWWFSWTTLHTAIDDDVTPGAIRALLALFQVTRQQYYRDAAERGIAFLLARQLPNGAWPLGARPRWKQRLYGSYEDRASLNDGATTQAIVTVLGAARLLGRPELVAAARRAGDWIVRARHAPPQAGWAQQYDDDDVPAPARRYERVALTSWESRYAMEALVALADATGDSRYCAPIAAAARWLVASEISAGCWARLYEIGDNRPLYFNERREAVGSPAEAHQPYDWTGDFGIPNLLQRLLGAPYAGDELTARVPGDPGACPHPGALRFDPAHTTDPRRLIAWAGRIAAAIAPPPPRRPRAASVAKDEDRRRDETGRGRRIVPAQRLARPERRIAREDDHRDDLLRDLELREREHAVADAVRRHLKTILQETRSSSSPRSPGSEAGPVLQMPVPGDGHENIGAEEQKDGLYRGRERGHGAHSCRSGAAVTSVARDARRRRPLVATKRSRTSSDVHPRAMRAPRLAAPKRH